MFPDRSGPGRSSSGGQELTLKTVGVKRVGVRRERRRLCFFFVFFFKMSGSHLWLGDDTKCQHRQKEGGGEQNSSNLQILRKKTTIVYAPSLCFDLVAP